MNSYVSAISDFVAWFSNLSPVVAEWNSYAASLRLPIRIIGGMLLALALVFIIFFLFRGVWFRLKLGHVIRALRRSNNSTVDLSKLFSRDKALAHLWREYEHTLHKDKDINRQTGSQEVVSFRATVSAETFFNPQTLVDNRLRTEFFKHVPGICTGLGTNRIG
jgi:hypothetical protein